MVHLCNVLLRESRHFIDRLRVYVRGGRGGQGLPKYGGCGGAGGNVYVLADPDATLKKLNSSNPSKRFIATSGELSRVRTLVGTSGDDVILPVPTGIVVRNDTGRILGELNQPGEKLLVAKGGAGGTAANGFLGQIGHAYSILLDLKLIADVGLVGFPNAGKSTLLSAISRASPKIAAYPFTTLKPQLGVLEYEDYRQITVADLPGLIEGAHVNIGLGHEFLKHVERTKLLLFVVDVHGFRLSQKHATRSAFETIILLNKELELYKEDLTAKPAILAINKIDIPDSNPLIDEVQAKVKNIEECVLELPEEYRPKKLIRFDDTILISAKRRLSTLLLQNRLRELLDFYADIQNEKTKLETSERLHNIVQKQLVEHFNNGRLI